jgi:hypothetical protein
MMFALMMASVSFDVDRYSDADVLIGIAASSDVVGYTSPDLGLRRFGGGTDELRGDSVARPGKPKCNLHSDLQKKAAALPSRNAAAE